MQELVYNEQEPSFEKWRNFDQTDGQRILEQQPFRL